MNIQNENKKSEDLKFIYNFYTKHIGETKEFKNMIKKIKVKRKKKAKKKKGKKKK